MLELPTLETSIVTHCNNACVGCNHLSPILPKWFLDPDDLANDLANLKNLVHVTRFYLLGGEPLLHPQIVTIANMIRQSGIANGVGVTTNGQLLERMGRDFWLAIDSLIVDRYPGKLSDAQLDAIRAKADEYKIDLQIQTPDKFYKCVYREPLNATQARANFETCFYKTRCRTIQRGRFYLCPQSAFIPNAVMNLSSVVDGLSLGYLTEEELTRFINRADPLVSCAKCCRDDHYTAWREVNRAEWLEASSV